MTQNEDPCHCPWDAPSQWIPVEKRAPLPPFKFSCLELGWMGFARFTMGKNNCSRLHFLFLTLLSLHLIEWIVGSLTPQHSQNGQIDLLATPQEAGYLPLVSFDCCIALVIADRAGRWTGKRLAHVFTTKQWKSWCRKTPVRFNFPRSKRWGE